MKTKLKKQPAVVNARRTLQSILVARGRNYVDLASDIGLSHETVRNIACGNNTTRSGRQKIATALGVELWPPGPPDRRGKYLRKQRTKKPDASLQSESQAVSENPR